MQAGKLQHRVIVQTVTETAQPSGEKRQTWSTLATVWAAVMPVGGSEPWNADQAQPNVTHTVTLRSGGDITRATVTPKNRILYGTRILNIVSITDEEENGFKLTLNCMEKI